MINRPLCCTAILILLLAASISVAADTGVPTMDVPAVASPGQGGLLQSELIYPLDDKPTPQCHASTIVETPSGMVSGVT